MKQNIVLDTNILISGYLWKGKPRQAIEAIKTGNFGLDKWGHMFMHEKFILQISALQ